MTKNDYLSMLQMLKNEGATMSGSMKVFKEV